MFVEAGFFLKRPADADQLIFREGPADKRQADGESLHDAARK